MTKHKLSEDGFESDAARYRKSREPHKTKAKRDAALAAFYDAVMELRVKYQIADLVMAHQTYLLEKDGAETGSIGIFTMGNSETWEAMAAFSYGFQKSQREEYLRLLLSGQVTEEE